MKLTIKGNKARALAFDPSTRSEEIMQNIIVIMSTPRGSVPGYRQFGIDMGYMHQPKPLARTMFVVALNNAIKAFEPRARLDGVTFDDDSADDEAGVLNPILEVTIDE